MATVIIACDYVVAEDEDDTAVHCGAEVDRVSVVMEADHAVVASILEKTDGQNRTCASGHCDPPLTIIKE